MKKLTSLLIFQFGILYALIAQPMFANMQLGDIQSYSTYMTPQPIIGNDDYSNQLFTGTVICYQTNEGRYGKLKIIQYGYNLVLDWVTFNNDGSIYTVGGNLTIRGTGFCDLDLGKESSTSADFWWEQRTDVIRNLVPRNNAKFYKIVYSKPVKVPKIKTTQSETQPTISDEDKIIGTDDKGRTVYQSPKGGRYYINSNGNKTYIKGGVPVTNNTPQVNAVGVKQPKPLKKRYVPRKEVANSSTYYEADFNMIKSLESKMKEDVKYGGFEGSPFHLETGSILFYKTTKGNYGKLQILSFGKMDTVYELYTRWTTFNEKGSVVNSNEMSENIINDNFNANNVKDLDGSAFPGWEYSWDIVNDLFFLKARKDAKFYLLKDNESITPQQTNTPNTSKEVTVSGNVTWQHHLSNNSTTSNATFDFKACVETSETVKEYTLIHNGQRLSIARGLIPRKAHDCANAFSQTVNLKDGENTFQLVVQTTKGEIQSSVFNIIFDKNSTPSEPIATETKIEKRIALVVGNADYSEGSKLKNPINDANLMTQTLKNLGFKVMQYNNVKKAEFERAIREFSNVLADYNVALFYYAGHGVQVDGENYLLPIDAKLQDKKDVRFEAVKVRFAVEEFENHPDNVNIVILDACRNNPFRSWARGGAEGFKQMNIGGTFVAFATAPDATASDGTGSNGLYTEELTKQLLVNQPIEAVFRETRKAVLQRSSRTQNPQEWSQLTQSFYFKK